MSDLIDQLRALDPERDGASGAPPLGWLRALLDAAPEPRRERWRPRRAAAPRDAPSHRRQRPIAVGVALACLAALALIAVAVLGGGTDPRKDALVPAGSDEPVIVHVVTRTTIDGASGRPVHATFGRVGTLDGPVERWTVGPDRWRQRLTLTPGGSRPGGTIDSAYAHGVQVTRNSWQRRARRQRIAPPGSRLEPALLFAGVPSQRAVALLNGVADPRATVEQMLRSGEVISLDEVTHTGRRLLPLFSETPRRRSGPRAWTPGMRMTWFVDAETYVPVELRIRAEFGTTGAATSDDGSRTVFDVYETLPLNRATERLLRLGGRTR